MATAGEKPPVGIDNGVESGDAVKPQKEDAKISDRLRSQKPKTAESPNQPATSHQGEASETKQETKQEAKQEDSKVGSQLHQTTLPELRVLYPQHSSSVPRVDIVAIHDLGETLDKAWIYRRKQRKRQNDSLLSRVTAPTKSAPPGEGGRPGSDGSPVPGPSKGKPPTSLSAIRHFLDRGDPPDMAGLVDGATANPAGPSTQPAGRPTSPRDGQPSAGQSNNPTAPEQGTRNLAAGRANDIPSDRPSTDRGSARGVNWLIDALMLPAEVPGVRVMCYEYTCPDVAAKDPSKFLRDTAVDLLHRLRHKRPTAEKGYAQVPIIFIGLGLGALIAQQAIVNLQIPSDGKPDSEADTVLDIVAGVLLLDAPSPQISDPNFPLSRSQASKKSWTDDWFVSPASSSLPTTKIDALSLWIEFSAASSAKKICLSWYYDPAKGGENARIHRDDIMLLGKVSDTAHRLSRFDGPGDVDYKSLVNIIKRSILVRYCSTKSLKWHFLDVSKYMYSFRLRDQQGLTPLHVAAEAGNLTAVKALTNKDATLIREKDNDWRPPLTTAIRRAARQIGEQTQSEEETKSSFAPIIKFLVKSDPSSGLQLENRDRFGFLPWRYATGDENQWIRRLKKKLVEGNSLAENHVMERVLVPEPGSAQSKACDAFDVILVEVFLEKNRNRTKEKFNRDFSSVTDIIYNGKDGVSRILDESRPDNSPRSKVFCRWVHLPSNNEQWVRDLLISMGYQDGSMGGQRHEGKQIIDRYMTPQAKRYVHSHGFTDENEPTEKPATLRHERSSETGKTITLQPSDVAASGNTPVSPIPNSPYPGGKESNAIVIFLPILGFETHRHRKYLSEAIKRAAGVATSHGDAMLPTKDSIKRTGLSPEAQSNESLVLDGYLNSDEVKPVHCRRTLDQFAYYMLESTEFRDSSQVAYRWAKNTGACSKAKDRPIIMVDQLWLWLLHDGTVISSFPSTWGDDDDFDHMKVLVNELGKNKERPGMERPLIRSAEHLLHILLRTSLDFGKRNGPAGFRFEDCFLSSINNVAEKQNGLFQKFRKVIEALENDKISPKDKKDQMKALFRLDEETGLLVEITDILDELTIIKTVLTQQQAVIQDLVQLYLKARDEDEDSEGDNADETQSRGGFRASNAPAEGSASQQGGKIQKQKEVNPKPTPSLSRTENTAKTQQEPARTQASLPAKSEGAEKGAQKNKRVELLQHRDLIFGTSAIVENHIRVTKDMLGMAEGVRESLKALLDLKQKHANGWEARFSREGSEATQWQGNVILFFTIVTAIFLPLSFMASFFALSIDVFPKDTTSQQTSWPLNRVCSYLCKHHLFITCWLPVWN
ncbi:hypothetical protein QBC47DRAFT_291905 [Echria macrotheca]|uniref:Ankyrin repeat protein n=1 Tax=Echria macrotheca TaxID=438768 RepID=A0AAJ0BK93_9PEZI|nr:hypothetical protein QBC47DRAFT_291905 [Echria macrotheca]